MYGWFCGRDPEDADDEYIETLRMQRSCRETQIRLLSEQLSRVLRYRTAEEWESWSWKEATKDDE